MSERATQPSVETHATSLAEAPPHRQPVPSQHFGYKQRRSLETFERLLDAAEQLTEEGQSFEDVSVGDVCERAGQSVGAFYRRFESKDGLLACLHERYAERVFERQARALDPARWEGIGLAEMLEQLVAEAFGTMENELRFVRASELRAQTDPGFARRERKIHDEYLALFTRLLMQRVEEIGHPYPRMSAEFCAYQLRAVLYYFFVTTSMLNVGDGPRSSFDVDRSISPHDAARELATTLISYLQVAA